MIFCDRCGKKCQIGRTLPGCKISDGKKMPMRLYILCKECSGEFKRKGVHVQVVKDLDDPASVYDEEQEEYVSISEKIQNLMDEWKKVSDHSDRKNSPIYKEIVDFGQQAIPYLIRSLYKDRSEWHHFLQKILNTSPVSKADASDMDKVVAAWTRIGMKRGFISEQMIQKYESSKESGNKIIVDAHMKGEVLICIDNELRTYEYPIRLISKLKDKSDADIEIHDSFVDFVKVKVKLPLENIQKLLPV